MRVKDVMKVLADCDPSMLVVVPSSDHSYREVRASVAQATIKRGYIGEYYDGQELEPGERVAPVVVLE